LQERFRGCEGDGSQFVWIKLKERSYQWLRISKRAKMDDERFNVLFRHLDVCFTPRDDNSVVTLELNRVVRTRFAENHCNLLAAADAFKKFLGARSVEQQGYGLPVRGDPATESPRHNWDVFSCAGTRMNCNAALDEGGVGFI
jgi:hypothetical protein